MIIISGRSAGFGLGAIRLVGSSTQRHVEQNVSVDGAPGLVLLNLRVAVRCLIDARR